MLRWLVLLLLVLAVLLQARLWSGPSGLPEVHKLERAVEAQRERNRMLDQRNRALAAEVDDLKLGEAAVEERAREELGLIKPGETFFRVIEDEREPRP